MRVRVMSWVWRVMAEGLSVCCRVCCRPGALVTARPPWRGRGTVQDVESVRSVRNGKSVRSVESVAAWERGARDRVGAGAEDVLGLAGWGGGVVALG